MIEEVEAPDSLRQLVGNLDDSADVCAVKAQTSVRTVYILIKKFGILLTRGGKHR